MLIVYPENKPDSSYVKMKFKKVKLKVVCGIFSDFFIKGLCLRNGRKSLDELRGSCGTV